MVKKAKALVLSFDERKKFASFVMILVMVEKRTAKEVKAKTKKKSKTKLKYKKIGLHQRKPFSLINFSTYSIISVSAL